MEELTVKDLLNLLQKFEDNGYGDFKIKCEDGDLHFDEIAINYLLKEVRLKGYLFHNDLIQKSQKLEEEIKVAIKNFYKD